MTVAKDELFCRLAIRQGVWTKEEASTVLREYRANAKTGEDIGKYAIGEGYVDAAVAHTIENAISHRASGHVAETKRRVPKRRNTRSGGGGGGARQPHHVHAATHRASARDASPLQLAGVAIGAVVLIGAVIFLIFKLQSGGPVDSPADLVGGKKKSTAAPEADKIKKMELDSLKKPSQITLNEKEITNLKAVVSTALGTARQEAGDGRFQNAVDHLLKCRAEIGGDQAPQVIQDLVARLDADAKEFRSLASERYAELLAELKTAQSTEDVQGALDDIERACGSAKRQEAVSSAPKVD